MKKIILLAFMTLAVAKGYSQEEGKFRVGLDFGYVPASSGGGGLISLEPKFNINDNMNVGLRIGGAAVVRDLVSNDDQEYTAKVAGISSLLGTYDYYFHESGSGNSFAPYIGGGIGYYSLANVEVDDSEANDSELNPAVSSKFGGVVRGGFEWGGFRMGLEYNFIPDSDLENLDGEKIGTAKNSYFGISIGFFVGGGKWSK